jgi:hypothetical protein
MTNKIMQSERTVSITLDVFITREDKYYVAYSPALEISGYGTTVRKAKESFGIEVKIFIEETYKRGTLEKYLLKKGWTLQQIPKIRYEAPKERTNKLLKTLKASPYFRVVQKQVNFPV